MYVDRDGNRHFRRLGKHAVKGLADILAVKNGQAYFIEVKKDGGRISPEQHEFCRTSIIAGAEYIIAKSIDDVQRIGL